MATVDRIMTADPITATRTTTLAEVETAFRQHAISSVPILDDGALVGIVTRREVMDTIDALIRTEAPPDTEPVAVPSLRHHTPRTQLIVERLASITAQAVMRRDPHTIERDADIIEAARTMAGHRTHHLLVLERGHLVGVLSTMDLVAWLADGADPPDSGV